MNIYPSNLLSFLFGIDYPYQHYHRSMTVPQAQNDPVLLIEHQYRNTKNIELVLPEESNIFEPVEKKGLGTFNYKLVDIDSISENEFSVKSSTVKVLTYAENKMSKMDRFTWFLLTSMIILAAVFMIKKIFSKSKGTNRKKRNLSGYYQHQSSLEKQDRKFDSDSEYENSPILKQYYSDFVFSMVSLLCLSFLYLIYLMVPI